MARVPIPAGNSVELRPMTDAKFRAYDNGGGVLGGIGEGLQRLGQAGSQYAETQQRINDEHDEATLKTSDNSLVSAIQPIRAGFISQMGLNAATAKADADKAIADVRKNTLSALKTPRLRSMFTPIVNQRLSLLAGEMQTHADQQAFAANDEASIARIQLAREDAAATTDPVGREKAIATAWGEIAGRAKSKGLSSDWVKAEGFKTESGIHRGVIERLMTADRMDEAIAYRDTHADKINGTDEASIATMLHDPLQRRETDHYVDGIMGRATAGDIPAPFSYSDPLHGLGRAPVPGGKFNAHRDYGGHQGIDIPAAQGTPIFASAPGTATVSHSPLGGNIVTVDHGNGRSTRYMHLGAVGVKNGDRVTPDTQIGGVGMTGRTSGPHLHYEVRENGKPVDPDHAIATVQQSPQRHDLALLLSQVDRDGSLTPEQRERYKAGIEQRVGRDEDLLRRTEGDAQRLALDHIANLGPDGFTSMSQIPATVRAGLSSADRQRFVEMAGSNAKQAATGEKVKADGPAYLARHVQSIVQPEAFAKVDLRMDAGSMTPGEYAGLLADQAKMRKNPEAPTTANIRGEIDGALKHWATVDGLSADLDARKNPAHYIQASKAMRTYLDRATDGGKRKPTDDDMKAAYDYATQSVVARGVGTFGGDRTMRQYAVKTADTDNIGISVPSEVASRIVASIQKTQRRNPSRSEIGRVYLQYRGAPGYWR